MTVVQCSVVLGMNILEYCKVYSFVDVNYIYDMSSNVYNYVTLELIYSIDDGIGYKVTYDIKRCTYT